MALARPPLLQTKVFAVASQKRFSALRDSQATLGGTTPALFRLKFNADWSESQTAGTAMTASTVTIDGTNIILDVNTALDRNIAHAALTVQAAIDAVNATQADGSKRWRAGLADVAPNTVMSAPLVPVMAEQASSLGYVDSIAAVQTTIENIFIGVGTDESNRGQGNFLPDGFDTLYDYPLTDLTGGLADPAPSQIGRSGGIDSVQGEDLLPQRRSAFPALNGSAALFQEGSSAALRFETVIDNIYTDAEVLDALNDSRPIRFRIYDGAGTLVWSHVTVSIVPPHDIDVPNVAVRGPAYVQVSSDGGGVTDDLITGTATVSGFTRRA